jgi:hypothetical protein
VTPCRYHGLKCALFSTDCLALTAYNAYLQARPLATQDSASAAAEAVASDAHVVFLHLTQSDFSSSLELIKFANDVLSAVSCVPEPFLAFILLSSDSLEPPHSVALQGESCVPAPHLSHKPFQSFMVHNAVQVTNYSVRAAVAMCHSTSVRRDLCQTFDLAAARESGALCTTRACHFPRELSFDFGFLSKYGA